MKEVYALNRLTVACPASIAVDLMTGSETAQPGNMLEHSGALRRHALSMPQVITWSELGWRTVYRLAAASAGHGCPKTNDLSRQAVGYNGMFGRSRQSQHFRVLLTFPALARRMQ